jgi:type IX secretion system PorP/SprF family membrane protein
MKHNRSTIKIFLLLFCVGGSIVSVAQQYMKNPVGQYYSNGYLWNPAYAGSKDHPSFYALLNKSWIGFEGSPTLVMFTGDIAFGKASGIGLKLLSDKSGMLYRTSVMLDYAYTLRFTNERRLRLGISAGTFSERLNAEGNALADPAIYGYNNDTRTNFDGSLGAVYEDGNFSAGASFYNLNSGYFSKNNSMDVALANFMASYTLLVTSGDSTTIKPLIGYKLYSQTGNIFTAGMQIEQRKIFYAGVLWQQTGNFIGSIGIRIGKTAEINCSYSSNNKYGYGQLWEIGLGIGLH